MAKGEVIIIAPPNGRGYKFSKGVYSYIKDKEERSFPVKINHLNRGTFRDEEYKVMIEENVRQAACFYVQDSNRQPADWLTEMMFALDALKFSSPQEGQLAAVMPYMRFARQDRKSESRVSVNAKVVAKAVSEYANRGIVVDLHVPQIQSFFDIPVDHLYSLPTFIEHLMKKHPKALDRLVVVAPDVGAAKRAGSLLKRLKQKGINAEMAIGYKTKERDNNAEKVQIIGNVRKRNCLLLDDIIDTGKTMVLAGEECRKRGAKTVYAYATHGLFTEGTERFSVFDKTFTSDTVYHKPDKKIETVSLVPLFGEAIYRTVTGQSLSDLFDR
jgi:ribose-phosphate pyrophosphokinase